MSPSNEHEKIDAALAQIRAKIANDETTNVHPLLQSELDDHEQDRKLKRSYARWFIRILIGQLVAMNVVFILAGCNKLHYEQWTLDLFMSGTLAEVFGVVVIITKNLFPKK